MEVRDLDEDEISAILAQPNPELEASAITLIESYITPVHVSEAWISLSRPSFGIALRSPVGKGRKDESALLARDRELLKAL